jgi:hypothetical protein
MSKKYFFLFALTAQIYCFFPTVAGGHSGHLFKLLCKNLFKKNLSVNFFLTLELSILGNDTSIFKTKLQLGGEIPKIEHIDVAFSLNV